MPTDKNSQGKKPDPLFASNMKKSYNYLHSQISL